MREEVELGTRVSFERGGSEALGLVRSKGLREVVELGTRFS